MNEPKYPTPTSPSPDEPLAPAHDVNLDKTTPAESSPATTDGTSGDTEAIERADGQVVDPEPSEGHSRRWSEQTINWITFVPLGTLAAVTGLMLEDGLPFWLSGCALLMIYMFYTLRDRWYEKETRRPRR